MSSTSETTDGELFKPENADKAWTKEQTDMLLNDVFNGAIPLVELAATYGRTRKSVERRVEQFTYTENGSLIHKYAPTEVREDRRGRPFENKNEINFILLHRERKVGLERTALILMRDVAEIVQFLRDRGLPETSHVSKQKQAVACPKNRRTPKNADLDEDEEDDGWDNFDDDEEQTDNGLVTGMITRRHWKEVMKASFQIEGHIEELRESLADCRGLAEAKKLTRVCLGEVAEVLEELQKNIPR